jgi:hypothetical protein
MNQLDVSIQRELGMAHQTNFQVRVDAINVLNNVQWGRPSPPARTWVDSRTDNIPPSSWSTTANGKRKSELRGIPRLILAVVHLHNLDRFGCTPITDVRAAEHLHRSGHQLRDLRITSTAEGTALLNACGVSRGTSTIVVASRL